MRVTPDEISPKSFSVHWQTAGDPDFQWTADRKWMTCKLVCLIPCTYWSGRLALETPKYFDVFKADQKLRSITEKRRKCFSGDWIEIRNI
jgi:hypothetical protein